MKKFTQEQIIQYLYGEAQPILKMAIDRALLSDEALVKEIEKLRKSKKRLDMLKNKSLSPSVETVEAIMAYARSTKKK